MGAYRSKPITDKVSSDESGKYVKCGASSMQGWRVTQEDAHNCIIEFDENTSLFAVYDGHGGHEVAQYCSENLPPYLKECSSYKTREYTKALKEAFLGFDATLVDPKVVKVLNNIVKSADDEVEGSENQNSASEDEENIRNLYEEAQMPLEEVMAKYQADGVNPALKKLKGGTPPSPYLVAKQSSKTKSTEEAGSSKAGSSSSGSGGGSSSSASSGAAEPAEESNDNTEKDDSEGSKHSKSEEKKKTVNESEELNGDKAPVDSSKEANGDGASRKDPDSGSGKSTANSEDAGSEKTSQKDNDDDKVTKGVKAECGTEEGKGSTEEPKVEKKQTDNHLKEEEESDKQETKEVKKESKKSPLKKVEVNGDVEEKDLKKELENEPHENGDVAEEDTEEEEEDENKKDASKSGKGKGKAIIKKSERPKRTSARQRNMAMLIRTFIAAQDSADSESDDEGDESFQGAEERSSSDDDEEEDKEEVEGEEGGEEEEEEEDDEEEGEEEEEEEECEEEDLPKIPKENFEQPGVESGCTAVVALLHGRDLYVANAGDSRCIVSRSGEALDMSLDHKPEDDIEIERIVAAGGFVSCDGRVNGGLNLSRAIGDHAYKQSENLSPEEQMITALPDVRTLSIDTEKDEFMVLACDGIWNSMTSQEVVNFVRTRLQSGEEKLLSQICEELFDFCLAPDTASDGTGCDNMTAVIVQFLPILKEAKSSDLPNTSISTATNKRPASPSEDSDSSAKRFKTGVV